MLTVLILILALVALATSIAGIVKRRMLIAACGQALGVVALFVIILKIV